LLRPALEQSAPSEEDAHLFPIIVYLQSSSLHYWLQSVVGFAHGQRFSLI